MYDVTTRRYYYKGEWIPEYEVASAQGPSGDLRYGITRQDDEQMAHMDGLRVMRGGPATASKAGGA